MIDLPTPLVSTAWLAEHLYAKELRIIDIRGHVLPASDPLPHYFAHYAEYMESHIPGAVFVDWVRDITDPNSPHAAQIAPPEAFAVLMGTLGIGENTPVVVYDDADSMFAARMWWALSYYGHEQVAVLDGGWKKWTAEGRPITAEKTSITPTAFRPHKNPYLRQAMAQIESALENPRFTLIDVRSVPEFYGEISRVRRKGHIPGAVNLPRTELVNPDGTMPAPDVIVTKLTQAGIALDRPAVTYCNAGVSASYMMLALKCAGMERVSIYDGSWKEWGGDPSKPIE